MTDNKKEKKAKHRNDNETLSLDFPIVGIGASAGGLSAFEAFFSGMPADKDPNMAFVLVQHLAPDHKSILTELIQRYTKMKVLEVEDGISVRQNCVYIIPPNKDMTLLNGTLLLVEPVSPRGQRMSIDFFFSSLANDQHEKAICILLSGTGSDGTLGLRNVKSEGGMVMVQSPASAEFNGMPESAIATGLVDYILAPSDMVTSIISYVDHAFGKLPVNNSHESDVENIIKKIHALIRNQSGHDFSQYKQNTILRRIERRMAVHQIKTMAEYYKFLRNTTKEVDSLFSDMLIGVTNFFRDTQAFESLDKKAITRIIESKPPHSTVRIWVPGCSTGEEAYSLAILFSEAKENLNKNIKIQIFASDIDKKAIEIARSGLYPYIIAENITTARLDKFLEFEEGLGYRVKNSLRDMIVFSEQDAIKDPPFSRLDLISCRNLLIYFGPQLQRNLIRLFHYALNEDGFLFLGTSETIGEFDDIFAVIDRVSKIYQAKSGNSISSRLNLGTFLSSNSMKPKPVIDMKKHEISKSKKIREITEKALLIKMAQTAVLVNKKGDILYIHGHTGEYLEPTPGIAEKNNIIKMAREGLEQELKTGLFKAVSNNHSIKCLNIQVKTNGDYTSVNLSIHPVESIPELSEISIRKTGAKEYLYLIVLEHSANETVKHISTKEISDGSDSGEIIRKLKRELITKEEYIQITNREIESANEELQSSNEEMQSINEELQSTNEELETSKEELQSINEELSTVNSELQAKLNELTKVNNDMNNLLAGTGIGTVFVDFDLKILRFNPSITKVINLINTDTGRSISHIASNLEDYTTLISDTQEVLDTLIPKEIEVTTKLGQSYNMSILPYRTIENVIEGAVITFVNITERKKLEIALRESSDKMAEAFIGIVREAFVVLDLKLRIIYANNSFYRMFSLNPEGSIGNHFYEISGRKLGTSGFRKLLEEILPRNTKISDYEVIQEVKGIGVRKILINGSCVFSKSSEPDLILLAFEDVTDTK